MEEEKDWRKEALICRALNEEVMTRERFIEAVTVCEMQIRMRRVVERRRDGSIV